MMQLYHILGFPLGYIMRFIYGFCNNYGVAIILFTLFIRLILFPVGYNTQKNSAKMQSLNPKLEKLRKSYQNNPEKLQVEQSKLYREEHINPMASCLPMLIQFIILFGVIDVIYRPLTHILHYSSKVVSNATQALTDAGDTHFKGNNLREELYVLADSVNDNFTGVLSGVKGVDLSKLQQFYENFQIFGIHLGRQPSIHPEGGWNYESVALICIPILAGVLQLILTIISQIMAKKNRSGEKVAGMGAMNATMYIMPIFSIWFAYIVPAGVGFYWICSSFFSLIQTVGLNLYFTPERAEKVLKKDKIKYEKKHGNKASFYDRMMEQAALQNGQSIENDDKKDNISRRQKSVADRELLAKRRDELAKKYGIDTSEKEETEDETDNDPVIQEARKRMAEKYGDVIK